MSLLCDKYRPNSLMKVDYNRKQSEQLKQLISSGNFPHLFIFGPSGSGKKTRTYAVLKELFGSGVEKLRLEHKQFETSYGKKIDQTVMSSNYHLEVNPSDAGFYDRIIIQELIKDLATNSSLTEKHSFKVVVITEADKLSREAQHGLRRTLEKYVTTCRVILIGESSSRVIPAVKSRCLLIRNGSPTFKEISTILLTIARKEVINISPEMADKIANNCNRNLRRAVLMLETYSVRSSNSSVGTDVEVPQPQWKQQILNISKRMTESQSLQRISEIRNAFFQLQTHLVPNDLIMRELTVELLRNCLDENMKNSLISMSADYEHKMRLGSKAIYHLEAFAVRFMTMFKCAVEGIQMDCDQSFDL